MHNFFWDTLYEFNNSSMNGNGWKIPTDLIMLLSILFKMLMILGLNFDRLELLVAETFGEEENSILETAR